MEPASWWPARWPGQLDGPGLCVLVGVTLLNDGPFTILVELD
jgi:D-Tyr-tRNAtyr deacylase